MAKLNLYESLVGVGVAAAVAMLGVLVAEGFAMSKSHGAMEVRLKNLETQVSKIDLTTEESRQLIYDGNEARASGFNGIQVQLGVLAERLSGLEESPDRILRALGLDLPKGVSPVIVRGNMYFVAKTEEADKLLALNGYEKNSKLAGVVPAYLIRSDVLPKIPHE